MSHTASLLLLTLAAVAGLVFLIARWKVNAFVALMLASLFVGVCAGLPVADVPKIFLEGVGSVLGSIAAVIALGTILGRMLAESGGAQVIAAPIVRAFGPARLPLAIVVIAFLVGFPVWFTVGLVLLVPIVLALAKESNTPLLALGIPLLASLAVAHGLVPPHPGPLAAIEFFKADTGKTIFYSTVIGFPTALIVGLTLGGPMGRRVPVALGKFAEQFTSKSPPGNPPGFGLTLFTILLPILLILAATVADLTLPKANAVRAAVDCLGHPLTAMLAGVLFSFWSFGFARGFSSQQILRFSEECLAPVGMVFLVVGCGGGFGKILTAAGVGKMLAEFAEGARLSPLLLAWLVAASIRIATGSATVSITTAAGLVADYADRTPGTNRELMVIAAGAGSSILSHLNDGGFWFVKEYFNLTVTQTLKTWTVMISVVSVVGLGLTLLLDALL
ncbi:MAG: permease DsdX [Verrucomicrobia bacterium]|nr:permease DsdX [Verrucomicrobiota bacterium]